MKFYVAAKYERRLEARDLMRRLRLLGHTVVGDWTYHSVEGLEPDEAQRMLVAFAKEDRAAVEDCEAFAVLHEDNPRSGAHLVELGMALGYGSAEAHVIGGEGKAPDRGAIFYLLPDVRHHRDAEEFLTWVEAHHDAQ